MAVPALPPKVIPVGFRDEPNAALFPTVRTSPLAAVRLTDPVPPPIQMSPPFVFAELKLEATIEPLLPPKLLQIMTCNGLVLEFAVASTVEFRIIFPKDLIVNADPAGNTPPLRIELLRVMSPLAVTSVVEPVIVKDATASAALFVRLREP